MSNKQAGQVERRVRHYPLEIKDCSGGDCPTLMSKGHQDIAAFLVAAREYWGASLYGFDEPAHTWWRWVPARPDDDCRGYYHTSEPHARGAFPCTVITQW